MNLPGEHALGSRSALAAALLAIDPAGLGGAVLRSAPSPWREAWLASLRSLQPGAAPWLRVPPSVGDTALLGGLDLTATLHTGRPVAQPGLLARADGGCLLLPMAERVAPGVAAHLCTVLDRQQVQLERDGLTQIHPARLALIALDEGASDDERLPAALLERLAFHLLPDTLVDGDSPTDWSAADVVQARERLAQVVVPEPVLTGLCAAALAWGIGSLRAPLMALRAARAVAALLGCDTVDDDHARLAAALVLAPRATQLPATGQPEDPAEVPSEPSLTDPPEAPPPGASPDSAEQAPPDPPAPESATEEPGPSDPKALEDQLVEAVRAAIPAGLLAALALAQGQPTPSGAVGKSGAALQHSQRGRPLGSRRAEPRSGVRLHVLDTLRAAAPWQRLRQHAALGTAREAQRLHIRREDFHVVRYRQHRPTTTVFVVDASGSAALHRLAEAKGAVELLLAECYVRRDRVAVLAFRGAGSEVLLPPTRSLARAKRSLSALPGGGGTPLAAGIEAAAELANQLARQGDSPLVVLLTDARANIARNGQPGRAAATQDALSAAQAFRLQALSALLIDTSPQPAEAAHTLAQALGATYLPLPHAGADRLAQAVQLVTRTPR